MGGKGGGGDGGAAAARAAEAARKARIAGNIDAVKRQFFRTADPIAVPSPIFVTDPVVASDGNSSPEAIRRSTTIINQAAIDAANAHNNQLTDQPTQARLDSFADIENRVRNRFVPDFEQDISDARRELKFALSRRNLLGSSGQADAESRLDDRIAQGQRGISERVANARSQKEAFDQNLMNNLIGQAQADVSRSSLLSGLGANLISNSERAINAANQQALGNIFGDVGTLFKEINDQRAIQQGLANAGLFANQQNSTRPTSLYSKSAQSNNSGNVFDY